jgi:hypothetical protein
MLKAFLSALWDRIIEPSQPEKVLTGTALVVYRQGYEVGFADYETGGPESGQTNPYEPGTRFFKTWNMGYRRGRDATMAIL